MAKPIRLVGLRKSPVASTCKLLGISLATPGLRACVCLYNQYFNIWQKNYPAHFAFLIEEMIGKNYHQKSLKLLNYFLFPLMSAPMGLVQQWWYMRQVRRQLDMPRWWHMRLCIGAADEYAKPEVDQTHVLLAS